MHVLHARLALVTMYEYCKKPVLYSSTVQVLISTANVFNTAGTVLYAASVISFIWTTTHASRPISNELPKIYMYLGSATRSSIVLYSWPSKTRTRG